MILKEPDTGGSDRELLSHAGPAFSESLRLSQGQRGSQLSKQTLFVLRPLLGLSKSAQKKCHVRVHCWPDSAMAQGQVMQSVSTTDETPRPGAG